LHTAEALPVCWSTLATVALEVWEEGVAPEWKPTVSPAADAVIQTAPAATATAPAASPKTRMTRTCRNVAMLLITPQSDLESAPYVHPKA